MTTNNPTLRWWTSDNEQDVRQRILARVTQLRSKARPRREMFQRWADFYGTSIRSAHLPEMSSLNKASRLSFNYARCYLDTWVSQLCKTRILPMVATTGGSYEAQRKARGLNLFIEAVFEECDVFDLDPQVTRDAGIFGTGIMYACEEFGRPCVIRVLPTELDYDEHEWRNGKGRSLYWTVPIDRSVLCAMYPDQEAEIMKAGPSSIDDMVNGTDASNTDLVTVRYAWHLPSGPKAKDGRYGAFIETATLAWEPYKDDDFPFVFFPTKRAIAGLWGDSIMAELAPGQLELDTWTGSLQESMLLLGTTRIFIKRGAKINEEKLINSNLPATMIEVDDPSTDIREWNPQPISPQANGYIEMLISKMAAVSTVSPMAAMGEKPTGITAASALELMDDQESERKIVPQRNRERAYVKLAKLLKKICSDIPKYRVKARDGHSIVDVKLSDVNLDDDDLVYTVMPTSFMAKTAAARMQNAQDLMKLLPNKLTADQVMKLIDIPDMQSDTSLMTAQRDNIARRLEKILYDGEYQPPNAMLNLPMAASLANDYYALGEMNGVPEENLDLLRQFSVAVQHLLSPPPKPQPPPGPPGMPPGPTGGPPGLPGPPPGGAPPMNPNMPAGMIPPPQGAPQ